MWKSTVCARAGNNPATSRRFLLLAGLLCGLALVTAAPGARADNGGYFRIATGTTDGTYFPIGALIAAAISTTIAPTRIGPVSAVPLTAITPESACTVGS